MTWRVAKSLLQLRDEVNAAFPNRDKSNDGTIGDTAHASRSSDHNPWVDGNVVTALDITHDPLHGCDCHTLASQLRDGRDKRIKYIIWDGQIANSQPLSGLPSFAWRKYTGANPHDKHMHVSVQPERELYDLTTPWLKPAPSLVAADEAGPQPGPAPAATPLEQFVQWLLQLIFGKGKPA